MVTMVCHSAPSNYWPVMVVFNICAYLRSSMVFLTPYINTFLPFTGILFLFSTNWFFLRTQVPIQRQTDACPLHCYVKSMLPVRLTSSDLEKKIKLREMSTLALAFYWVYNFYDIKLKTDIMYYSNMCKLMDIYLQGSWWFDCLICS